MAYHVADTQLNKSWRLAVFPMSCQFDSRCDPTELQKRNLRSLPAAVISIESWYCQEDKTWLPLAGISLSHREIFKSYLDCIDWQCLSCSMWYPRASAGVIGKPFWWAESLCNDVVTPLVTGTAVSLSSGSSPSSSSSSPKHQRKVERLIVSERSYKMLSQ